MAETPRWRFSLVDLVAIAALLFLIVSLILPGLPRAREAARRSQCQNNLRQLALATLNFETQSEKLPANRQVRASRSGPVTVGWLYDILPFLEGSTIYDRLKKDAEDPLANAAKIPTLICPTDSTTYRPTDVSYAVNGGCPNDPKTNFDTPYNGVSDDLASGELPGVRASSKSMKDGTTQTLYYLENLNAQRWNEDRFHHPEHCREYFHTILWQPVGVAQLNKVFSQAVLLPGKRLWPVNEGDPRDWGIEFARPSSEHPGGFQAAFAGGNIRYLTDSIAYDVYAQLLTSNGARASDPSDPSPAQSKRIRDWQSRLLAPQSYE